MREPDGVCLLDGRAEARLTKPIALQTPDAADSLMKSFLFMFLYESEFTFSPKIFPYNADVIAVWANEIGPLQISNRYKGSTRSLK
jgi:hypothetical protein